jgi:membrane protein YdbS with pleckstrin-like domain
MNRHPRWLDEWRVFRAFATLVLSVAVFFIVSTAASMGLAFMSDDTDVGVLAGGSILVLCAGIVLAFVVTVVRYWRNPR